MLSAWIADPPREPFAASTFKIIVVDDAARGTSVLRLAGIVTSKAAVARTSAESAVGAIRMTRWPVARAAPIVD